MVWIFNLTWKLQIELGTYLELENDNDISFRFQPMTVSHGFICLSHYNRAVIVLWISGLVFADKMTEAFRDSPAAWSGLSAAYCRGCIWVWLVYLLLGLYDAGC